MKFTGISFPFRISPSTGGVQIASVDDVGDTSLLNQSIMQIIGTQMGERVIEKPFGTDISSRIFDMLDDVTIQAINYSILKALVTWEPRVIITGVAIQQDFQAGVLSFNVKYSVIRTGAQQQFNFNL